MLPSPSAVRTATRTLQQLAEMPDTELLQPSIDHRAEPLSARVYSSRTPLSPARDDLAHSHQPMSTSAVKLDSAPTPPPRLGSPVPSRASPASKLTPPQLGSTFKLGRQSATAHSPPPTAAASLAMRASQSRQPVYSAIEPRAAHTAAVPQRLLLPAPTPAISSSPLRPSAATTISTAAAPDAASEQQIWTAVERVQSLLLAQAHSLSVAAAPSSASSLLASVQVAAGMLYSAAAQMGGVLQLCESLEASRRQEASAHASELAALRAAADSAHSHAAATWLTKLNDREEDMRHALSAAKQEVAVLSVRCRDAEARAHAAAAQVAARGEGTTALHTAVTQLQARLEKVQADNTRLSSEVAAAQKALAAAEGRAAWKQDAAQLDALSAAHRRYREEAHVSSFQLMMVNSEAERLVRYMRQAVEDAHLGAQAPSAPSAGAQYGAAKRLQLEHAASQQGEVVRLTAAAESAPSSDTDAAAQLKHSCEALVAALHAATAERDEARDAAVAAAARVRAEAEEELAQLRDELQKQMQSAHTAAAAAAMESVTAVLDAAAELDLSTSSVGAGDGCSGCEALSAQLQQLSSQLRNTIASEAAAKQRTVDAEVEQGAAQAIAAQLRMQYEEVSVQVEPLQRTVASLQRALLDAQEAAAEAQETKDAAVADALAEGRRAAEAEIDVRLAGLVSQRAADAVAAVEASVAARVAQEVAAAEARAHTDALEAAAAARTEHKHELQDQAVQLAAAHERDKRDAVAAAESAQRLAAERAAAAEEAVAAANKALKKAAACDSVAKRYADAARAELSKRRSVQAKLGEMLGSALVVVSVRPGQAASTSGGQPSPLRTPGKAAPSSSVLSVTTPARLTSPTTSSPGVPSAALLLLSPSAVDLTASGAAALSATPAATSTGTAVHALRDGHVYVTAAAVPSPASAATDGAAVSSSSLSSGLSYEYDAVIGSNEEASKQLCAQLASNMLSGVNVTLMAYGASGSGKTHLLVGDAADPGLAVRLLQRVQGAFRERCRNAVPSPQIVQVHVQALEVYHDRAYDLLTGVKGGDVLALGSAYAEAGEGHGGAKWTRLLSAIATSTTVQLLKTVTSPGARPGLGAAAVEAEVPGVSELQQATRVPVTAPVGGATLVDGIEALLHVAYTKRKGGADSHTLVRVLLEGPAADVRHRVKAALTLLDCATPASTTAAPSLVALERCLLAIQHKATYVPFRDDRLTQLLREGAALVAPVPAPPGAAAAAPTAASPRVVLMACVRAEAQHLVDSVATLNYATRCCGAHLAAAKSASS